MSALTEKIAARLVPKFPAPKFPATEGWMCWELKIRKGRHMTKEEIQSILGENVEIGHFQQAINWIVCFYRPKKAE